MGFLGKLRILLGQLLKNFSLGYPKAEFLKKKHFFEELYKIFYENDCNLYLTKDETVMDIDNKYKDKLKKKIKFNNIISNEFYEKMNKK